MPKKIVVLDDDPVTLAILSKALAGDDRSLITARDGFEGYVLAVREKPDLIVTDVLLPSLDGFELCRKIRSTPELGSAKIILMSAVYKGIYFRQDHRESEADAFVGKPLDIEALKEKVRTLLGEPHPPA